MNLSIFGAGLITPIATNTLQHVAFIAAGLGLNPPSAFLVDGEPFGVRHCQWLGARMGAADRQIVLARRALLEAASGDARAPMPLLVCTSATRVGFTTDDARAIHAALDGGNEERWCSGRFRVVGSFSGAAGGFEALAKAQELVANGAPRVAIVAVDSFISLDAIRDLYPELASAWTSDPLAPSEGAAAVLVGPSDTAELARVLFADTRMGSGNDDDEANVDGAAMTALLRAVPPCPPIARWYGQSEAGLLRNNEWRYAVARNITRAHAEYEGVCLEHATGALGAAAGLAHVVYGVAVERSRTADDEPVPGGPIATWAISRDGTRGLAVLEVTK